MGVGDVDEVPGVERPEGDPDDGGDGGIPGWQHLGIDVDGPARRVWGASAEPGGDRIIERDYLRGRPPDGQLLGIVEVRVDGMRGDGVAV